MDILQGTDKNTKYMIGLYGCTIIQDASEHIGNWFAFQADDTTVINTVKEKIFNSDPSTAYIKTDFSGKTINQGALITAGDGVNKCSFYSIQLTSGSIIAYTDNCIM